MAAIRNTVAVSSYIRAVDSQVIEGRLIESPTTGARGVDRRAFGEFVGPNGELASYAIGWTTGTARDLGRLSIGIGAGNPGGATFHAIVFDNGDDYALTLTDEIFEQVPEGGPNISAEDARSHQDLPFIWWVADQVFARDHRAWWMRHWLMHTKCFVTPQVFDLREPVLLIVNDDDDDYWQLVGVTDPSDDGKILHLIHAIDHDPTLLDVLDLRPGECASR